YMSLS
ncbi:ATPase associated with various cellular activities family protein, partial [Chlamydia psittaci 84-8471/1]